MALDKVLDAIDRDLEKSLERLYALLRIPSVSTDPGFRDDHKKTPPVIPAAFCISQLSVFAS